MITKPEVFIIESLDPDDEGNGRIEGSIISHVLRLHGKNPVYRYVRTVEQLKTAVRDFGKSKYRYLHISAHANMEAMFTTNLEEINFKELANMLKPFFANRRLFVSACSMVNSNLAKEIIPQTGCYSIVGPREDIAFTDAAVVWLSIYHLMFSDNPNAMNHASLKRHLLNVSTLFGIELGYYSKSKILKRGYTRDILRKRTATKK